MPLPTLYPMTRDLTSITHPQHNKPNSIVLHVTATMILEASMDIAPRADGEIQRNFRSPALKGFEVSL
jgi:hypothetical protein